MFFFFYFLSARPANEQTIYRRPVLDNFVIIEYAVSTANFMSVLKKLRSRKSCKFYVLIFFLCSTVEVFGHDEMRFTSISDPV